MRIVAGPYRRFGTAHRSYLQGSVSGYLDPWRYYPIGCPETLVRNYHYTLRDIPEDLIYPVAETRIHPDGVCFGRMRCWWFRCFCCDDSTNWCQLPTASFSIIATPQIVSCSHPPLLKISDIDQSLDFSCVFHNLTFWRRSIICFIQGISPYRAVNTFHHGYKKPISLWCIKQRPLSVLKSVQITQRKTSTM